LGGFSRKIGLGGTKRDRSRPSVASYVLAKHGLWATQADIIKPLFDTFISSLGPYLQWSPADHLLASGELFRKICPDDQPMTVSGYVFRFSRAAKS
jgi:hypothetical protein